MVTIALPSPKSKLHLPVMKFLGEKGIKRPPLKGRRLYLTNDTDVVIFSRGWDIPILVYFGIADLGVTGFDVVSELTSELKICEYWSAWRSRIVIAKYQGNGNSRKNGEIIVTEYPNLTAKYLKANGITAKLIPIRGAAESLAGVKKVCAIVTLETSGITLEENNLIVLDTLMETDACLISLPMLDNPSKIFWDTLAAISEA